MRILICGSRGWRDPAPIEELIVRRKAECAARGERFEVLHGHCRDGADALADRLAQRHGLSVADGTLIRVPADWLRYGKSAGFRRNYRMATEFHPDEVHAFRAAGKSNGTDNMVEIARSLEIPTYITAVQFGRPSETRSHATPNRSVR